MSVLTKLKSIVPVYARLPLIIVALMHCGSYFFTKLVTTDFYHYDLSVALDDVLPFCSFFIVFYIGAYIQWVLSLTYHARQSREICYKLSAGYIISGILCIVFFLAMPTEIVRPEITENTVFGFLTKAIYYFDTPAVNLFPSMHCLASWVCFRTALWIRPIKKLYVAFQLVFTLLVFLSTVFLKQHFAVDILGGILVGEIGLLVATKTGFWRIFVKRKAHSIVDEQISVNLNQGAKDEK